MDEFPEYFTPDYQNSIAELRAKIMANYDGEFPIWCSCPDRDNEEDLDEDYYKLNVIKEELEARGFVCKLEMSSNLSERYWSIMVTTS